MIAVLIKRKLYGPHDFNMMFSFCNFVNFCNGYGRVILLNISPKLAGIKRWDNERKVVSRKDAHFLSLPQNAKFGFKTFARLLRMTLHELSNSVFARLDFSKLCLRSERMSMRHQYVCDFWKRCFCPCRHGFEQLAYMLRIGRTFVVPVEETELVFCCSSL
jgi:hypothetical protein